MAKKLTSTERIGLLLTAILLTLICIALAIIPRQGAQPVAPTENADSIDSSPTPPIPSPSPSENSKPNQRTPLNETF